MRTDSPAGRRGGDDRQVAHADTAIFSVLGIGVAVRVRMAAHPHLRVKRPSSPACVLNAETMKLLRRWPSGARKMVETPASA